MGGSGSTGQEALAVAEKNAALLTARAGARDPSAIPSICRISAALHYPSGKTPSVKPFIKGKEAIYEKTEAKFVNRVWFL